MSNDGKIFLAFVVVIVLFAIIIAGNKHQVYLIDVGSHTAGK